MPAALREDERLVEERHRGRVARKLVPADAEPEKELGPVDVGEDRAFSELMAPVRSSTAARTSPSCIRAQASPERVRTSSSTEFVAETAARTSA